MAEHLIRLRAAWEGDFPAERDRFRRRIDLPAVWDPAPRAPFRLRRRFQAPRAGEGEEVVLRLARVPGLAAVWLNGREVGPGAERVLAGFLKAGGNELVLDVDPRDWPPEVAAGAETWGEVALAIRPRPLVGGRDAETL
jgi:hypothetical protein